MKISYDHDSMVERDRWSRWALLILSGAVVVMVPMVVGAYTGTVINFPGSMFLFGGAGLSLGVFLAYKLFPRFWVVVPQTASFVTTDQFAASGKNPNIPYGPGGHPAFPWELRAESGNITLDVLTVSFKETVPTHTTAVIVEGTVQFKFELSHITTVVGIDVTTVEQGFIAQINEWFSNRLAGEDGDWARNNIKVLRKEIEDFFEKDPVDPHRENRRQMLLDEYGIRVTGFQISSIDFPAKVQEVRDTIEETKKIAEGVWRLLGFDSKEAFDEARRNGTINEQDIARARDDFLAASGNVKKNVNKIDITGLDKSVATAVAGLTNIFKKGGDK